MITDSLYQKALIEPLEHGANKLYIVSGYASANMASRHIKDILEYDSGIAISLIVGMCPIDGVDKVSHEGFISLMGGGLGVDFECKYVYENPAVHSKVYVWCKDAKPLVAFTGSANYTQPAFRSSRRKEVLVACEASLAYSYFEEIEKNTVYCNHCEVEDYVKVTKRQASRRTEEGGEVENTDTQQRPLQDTEKITLSLLQRGGDVGQRSGLNWGQRPGREPNQAYIPLATSIARQNFFPLEKAHFSVLTDDNKYLILRAEQQNDKALTTPLNNSLLGEYFRNRLGLANGQFVEKAHLERYGRTDVDFYKIDEETFYMDFSVR